MVNRSEEHGKTDLHASSDRPRMLTSTGLQNLSGRALRRLPIMSLAMYARQDPYPIEEALGALSQGVDEATAPTCNLSSSEAGLMSG